MRKRYSAGGVLFNSRGQVYLTYKKKRNEWALPKGGVEEGETSLETAIREVKEETGYQNIEPLSGQPVNVVSWTYTREDTGEEEEKTTDFYAFKLIEDSKEQTREMEDEGFEGDWFTSTEALEKSAFDDVKETIQKALKVAGLE